MEFKQLIKRAMEIKTKYDELDIKQYNESRTYAQNMEGFVVDVGELMELVIAKQGIKEIENLDAKLAHELSDCLYSILILATRFGIDLEKEFIKTIDGLEMKIDNNLTAQFLHN